MIICLLLNDSRIEHATSFFYLPLRILSISSREATRDSPFWASNIPNTVPRAFELPIIPPSTCHTSWETFTETRDPPLSFMNSIRRSIWLDMCSRKMKTDHLTAVLCTRQASFDGCGSVEFAAVTARQSLVKKIIDLRLVFGPWCRKENALSIHNARQRH